MAHRLTVVVSQSRSQNPKKRELEEQIVAELLGERGVDVTVVPNLYDLKADGSGMLCLSGISGDLVVCSWLFPRAARWILNRNKICGQEGSSLLKSPGESADDHGEQDNRERVDDQDRDAQTPADDLADKLRVIDRLELPSRNIYCLDLRTYDSASVYLEEIRRIARELSTPTVELTSWIKGNPKPAQMERYLRADNEEGGDSLAGKAESDAASGKPTTFASGKPTTFASGTNGQQLNGDGPIIIDEDASRRWYPVIDFGRCTNCLECIDFCLFGVYGIDGQETILVEQPDNCRQGCPACSRVCPENAIIFPQHKTPTIAGSPEVGGNLKIDLSQLFGAPDPGQHGAATAVEVAARERDEQLLLAGRESVGLDVGIPKRHANNPSDGTQHDGQQHNGQPQDDLDRLMDSLDELDL